MLTPIFSSRVWVVCLAMVVLLATGCQSGPTGAGANPFGALPIQSGTPQSGAPQSGAQGTVAAAPQTSGAFAIPPTAARSPVSSNAPQAVAPVQPVSTPQRSFSIPKPSGAGTVPPQYGQTPGQMQNQAGGQVQQVSYQSPDPPPPTLGSVGTIPNQGVAGAVYPPGAGVDGLPPANLTLPQNFADLDVVLSETQTGRINFGGAYNSDNGIVGQFVIDERNFDWLAFPHSFREIVDGTAWRGAGQTFRLELVPGAVVQRYLVSFGEPYLFSTAVSFNFSAYLFDRQYDDWNEQRLGGRVALGYRLTPDLSVSAGLRMENVRISDPRVGSSPQLNDALGDTDLYVANVGLIRDTRDHPFMATEGTYFAATFNQAFGENKYSRADLDYRRYRLLYQRPDGSGRHTLSFGSKVGFTGEDTPVFENYFAGGFSSMRGFDFRGASPVEGGVRVGGEFQWLNSLEYTFPMTADDMIKGVVFMDFGTVEETITINSENFRVAPGFGFRIHMPAAGIGAPLAFDFAFPINSAEFDEQKIFSFYLGVLR